MKKLFILLLLTTSACAYFKKPIQLQTTFDASQAEKQLENGSVTLTGEAFFRQRGGAIVTCAGNEVFLIPETQYASERMMHIYGSPYQGYRSAIDIKYSPVTFIPDDTSYHTYKKNTICDAQGHFKFTNLKKGKYIIIARAIWETASGYYNAFHGGDFMQQVDVREDNQHIILTQ